MYVCMYICMNVYTYKFCFLLLLLNCKHPVKNKM